MGQESAAVQAYMFFCQRCDDYRREGYPCRTLVDLLRAKDQSLIVFLAKNFPNAFLESYAVTLLNATIDLRQVQAMRALLGSRTWSKRQLDNALTRAMDFDRGPGYVVTMFSYDILSTLASMQSEPWRIRIFERLAEHQVYLPYHELRGIVDGYLEAAFRHYRLAWSHYHSGRRFQGELGIADRLLAELEAGVVPYLPQAMAEGDDMLLRISSLRELPEYLLFYQQQNQ
jgi:hypothetical protein